MVDSLLPRFGGWPVPGTDESGPDESAAGWSEKSAAAGAAAAAERRTGGDAGADTDVGADADAGADADVGAATAASSPALNRVSHPVHLKVRPSLSAPILNFFPHDGHATTVDSAIPQLQKHNRSESNPPRAEHPPWGSSGGL